MAKKKEELSYLQMPLPSGQSTKRSVKVDWSGLNYRKKTDTGTMSYEKNISTKEAPCLSPSGTFKEVYSFGDVPHEETYDISEQGFYKVENGVLVYDDGEKRNAIGVPMAYNGTVIVPDNLTDDSNNRISCFSDAKGATLFVAKQGYNYLDISTRNSDTEYDILFTSGVTRILSCRNGSYSTDNGYTYSKAIWIPKTVSYIAPDSIPSNGRVCYEGSEQEWKNIVFGYSRYWEYTGEVIYNSTGRSFDPDDYTTATPQLFTESVIDSNEDHFTIVDYVLTAYTGSSKRIKIPGGVVSVAHSFAETAVLIEEIQFPSTIKEFTFWHDYESLKSVSVYQSSDKTGTKTVGVGTEKGMRIAGKGADLFSLYYFVPDSNNVYAGKIKLAFFDSRYERTAVGALGPDVYLSDLPDSTISFFSSFSGDIASVEKSNTTEKLLVYPLNYSWESTKINAIPYRYGRLKYGYKDPWAFVKDFKDIKCIYYVYEQQGNHTVPDTSDVPHNYRMYEFPDQSARLPLDNALGYWYYSTDGKCWKKQVYTITVPEPSKFSTDSNPCPELSGAAVFQSRIFGVDNGKVFVSGFNDYSKWTLDTADSSNSANAWITALNSNPAAYGDITAITAYQDRVIVFREKHMYEIRGTKNPFRVVDIFQEGCIGKDAVCVAGGYLFFASGDGIKMYTGAKPKDISEPLGIDKIFYAAMGTDGRSLFVYCNTDKGANNLFVYDTTYGIWSEMEWDQKVLCFTNNDNGLYMLCEDNKIYHYEDREYSADWVAETDMSLAGTVDIKHLKKIQLYAEMSSGSRLSVILIQANEDGSTTELQVCEERNLDSGTKTIPIRVVPRKTASHGYKVRFEGSGYVKLYQMELTLSGGGELYG